MFSASVSPAANALFVVTNQGKVEERHLFRVPLTGGDSATHHRDSRHPFASTLARRPILRRHLLQRQHPAGPLSDQRLRISGLSPFHAYRSRTPRLPEFNEYHWVTAKYVDFPNVNDGTMLHARLTLPPGFDPKKKYPAILGSVYSNYRP